ncbi:MAG: DNA polymerase, partial [Actinomycetota bacterium]|nr:DNA polymerase [Actinomycetota bacterium]
AERFGDGHGGAGGGNGPVRRDGLVLVVHDELVAEVPAEHGEEAAALVTEGMLAAARELLGDVPAEVDASVSPRWGPLETRGGGHPLPDR